MDLRCRPALTSLAAVIGLLMLPWSAAAQCGHCLYAIIIMAGDAPPPGTQYELCVFNTAGSADTASFEFWPSESAGTADQRLAVEVAPREIKCVTFTPPGAGVLVREFYPPPKCFAFIAPEDVGTDSAVAGIAAYCAVPPGLTSPLVTQVWLLNDGVRQAKIDHLHQTSMSMIRAIRD
jgi:hypothetical protein